MIDYRISPTRGFSEKIGELVSMLEHTRAVTISEIEHLRQEELDFLPDESANSIGGLLSHIASIEFVHQIISLEKRDPTESELQKWTDSLELGNNARTNIKCKSIEYYLNELKTVREDTLSLLQEKEDSWLFEENKWDNGVPFNNYYLWFHVMEDEINHRGQIRVIKRQMNR
ncbi:DinB family protein [Virgibacillus kekensis]|uniref:DinB family protein n=1 Tax=Virgibacillus kekensis TaxID=202261 RepID=A0ABV9DP68_9BACI